MKLIPFILLQGANGNRLALNDQDYEYYDLDFLFDSQCAVINIACVDYDQLHGNDQQRRQIILAKLESMTNKLRIELKDEFSLHEGVDFYFQDRRKLIITRTGCLKLIQSLEQRIDKISQHAAIWLRLFYATICENKIEMWRQIFVEAKNNIEHGFRYVNYQIETGPLHVFYISTDIYIHPTLFNISSQLATRMRTVLAEGIKNLLGKQFLIGRFFDNFNGQNVKAIGLTDEEFKEFALKRDLVDCPLDSDGSMEMQRVSADRARSNDNKDLKKKKETGKNANRQRDEMPFLTQILTTAGAKLESLFSGLEISSNQEQVSDDFLQQAYDKAKKAVASIGQRVDQEITDAVKSFAQFKTMWLVTKARNKLQAEIYDKPVIEYPQKTELIELVRETITNINDIAALAKLYVFINLPLNRDKLNIHKSPIKDTLLLNGNTKSWQKLLDNIREHAFNVLLKKVKITPQQWAFISGGHESDPPIENAKEKSDMLKSYKNELIFVQHHSNKNVFNLFHVTRTSGNIRKLIHYCDRQCERQHLDNARELLPQVKQT